MNSQYSFAYEWCDIPAGITVADYRTRRTRPQRRHIWRLWTRRA
jgi:hypothetical protein